MKIQKISTDNIFLLYRNSFRNSKFTKSVYHKPTFSGVYTDLERLLASDYKFGAVYGLAHRCFRSSSVLTIMEDLKQLKRSCNLQRSIKNMSRWSSTLQIKDFIFKGLTFGIVFKFHCGLSNECYYDKFKRHANVRINKHNSILPFTKKKTKPWILVRDDLRICNHLVYFDGYSTLICENITFLLCLQVTKKNLQNFINPYPDSVWAGSYLFYWKYGKSFFNSALFIMKLYFWDNQ